MRPYRPWLRRIHLAACALGVLLFTATLIEPQWIERLFDAAPDAGDGSAERWIVAGAFLVAAVLAGWLARREGMRRSATS